MISGYRSAYRTVPDSSGFRPRLDKGAVIKRSLLTALVLGLLPCLVWVGIIMQQGDRLNDVVGFFSCLVPLVVYTLVSGKKLTSMLEPSFGFLASVGFLVFFLAGFMQYLLNEREIGFAIVGPVTSGLVRDTMLGCALVASMLVVGDRLGRGRRPSAPAPASPASSIRTSVVLLSQVLWVLAFYGCLDVANSLGGFEAAQAQLGLHDRNVGIENSGTLGMSLWATFALPAVTTLSVIVLDGSRRAKLRLLTAVQAATILGFGVSMFGSRLLLVLSLVSLAFVYFKLRGRNPSLKIITAVLVLLMFVSSAVLGGRYEALNTHHDGSFLDSIGYSIFDVSIAAAGSLEELQPQLGSTERALTALSAAVPGSGGRAADISAARVDVIVVQAIGTQAQAANSGLPPSLPTSLLLGHELVHALIIALLVGIALGGLTRVLGALSSPLALVLFGLWGAFLFNTFKGGDLPMEMASEARRWAYVAFIYFVITFFTHKKEMSLVR